MGADAGQPCGLGLAGAARLAPVGAAGDRGRAQPACTDAFQGECYRDSVDGSRRSAVATRTPAGSKSRRGRTSTQTPARTAEPGRAQRLWGRAGHALSAVEVETWGVLVVLVGLLSALGIWLSVLGVAGDWLERAGAALLGTARLALPVVVLVIGGMMVAGRWGAILRRSVVGALLVLVTLAALADLVVGAPGLAATGQRLSRAGGSVGAVVGASLHHFLGAAGAALVVIVVGVFACWALAGLSPRQAFAVSGELFSRAAGARRARRAERGDVAQARVAVPEGGSGATGVLDHAGEHGAGVTRAAGPAQGRSGRLRRFGRPRGARHGGIAAVIEDGLGDLDGEDAGERGAAEARRGGDAGTGRPAPRHRERTVDGEADAEPGPARPGPLSRSAGGRAEDPERGQGGRSAEQLALRLDAAAGPWQLPPATLLTRGRPQAVDRKGLEARGRVLEDALAGHGVATHLVGMTPGPTVTRYELELGPGVKVARVTALAKDIAYALASADVRILAPIPGRSAIGVEVPNQRRQLVALGDLLASEEARASRHPLEIAVGRDIAGRAVVVNLAEMPHLLIAGATGAGKSSCLNSLLTSILLRATPDQVRLILVDPKRVELGQYNGLPHLLTPVVVNPKKAANALGWAVKEMERRYDLLAEAGVRDIAGYNAALARGELDSGTAGRALPSLRPLPTPEADEAAVAAGEAAGPVPLPFVLVVVDELNDLMMVAARDVEDSVMRIAQMARAVGIHLVIATQRPSVDVITGVIKANIPSRLAFAVSSLADSRVILDQPGAERLVGKGDMLLLTASSSHARRIQGPWVTEAEVAAVVGHWRRQSQPSYLEGVDGGEVAEQSGELDDDEYLAEAMELVVRSQLGSTSMLQRKLRVGFSRAGRLMDLLERRGVVGPSEGSKARAVLMTVEELEALGSSER